MSSSTQVPASSPRWHEHRLHRLRIQSLLLFYQLVFIAGTCGHATLLTSCVLTMPKQSRYKTAALYSYKVSKETTGVWTLTSVTDPEACKHDFLLPDGTKGGVPGVHEWHR
jgi:hypothetical protein